MYILRKPLNRTVRCGRDGKVLVLLAILLPTLFAVVGLVLDGGLMMDQCRGLQAATDAAATAAATDLRLGRSAAVATTTANEFVTLAHDLSDAAVTVNIPPTSGAHAGQPNHVEVIAERPYRSHLMRISDGIANRTIRTRSVAGVQDATAGAAIVVLDPDPVDLSLAGVDSLLASINVNGMVTAALPQTGVSSLLSSIPLVGPLAANLINSSLANLLPTQIMGTLSSATSSISLPILPTLTAGFELEGIGSLVVDGAILINNSWGGFDENGEVAGNGLAPPYGAACMPIVSTTRVRARDIRVVGGIDNQDFYQPFESGKRGTLQAGRLPVPDPLSAIPTPSTSSLGPVVNPSVQTPPHSVRIALPTAAANQLLNGVLDALSALLKPLFQPLIGDVTQLLTQPTLQPGVYDSITVVSPLGGARFAPGVYIIRGKSPLTQLSLCILGPVQAEGVLFYITDSAGYSAATGVPDANEDSEAAPANSLDSLLPSVVIATLLPTASMSGLNSPGSTLDGMLIYQRRLDRRPIVIEAQQLVGSGQISGTIYSKWGHVIFVAGAGSYDLRFVCGTMRVLTVFETVFAPTDLLPPARDVFLLE
jgi:hypothetical protein